MSIGPISSWSLGGARSCWSTLQADAETMKVSKLGSEWQRLPRWFKNKAGLIRNVTSFKERLPRWDTWRKKS